MRNEVDHRIWPKVIGGMALTLILSFGMLVAQETQPGGEPSGTGKTGELTAPAEENKSVKDAIEALTKEIGELTPGGFADNQALSERISAAIRTFMQNEPLNAMEQFDKIHREFPQVPPSAFVMASLYYSTGNAQEAQRRLEESAETDPGLPTIYNAFARVAINQGRKTDAAVLLEKSRALTDAGNFTDVERAFFKKANDDASADLMFLRNDFGDARRYLDTLIADYPDMAKTIFRLAQLDFREGKVDDALARLEKFKALTPDARVPELMLATMCVQAGRPDEASQWVQKAYKRYAADEKVLLECVDYMASRENFSEALKGLRDHDATIGATSTGLMLKGKIAFAQENFEQAETVFSELRTKEPSNIEVSTLLAMAMAERNDPVKLNKAVEMVAQNLQIQQQNQFVMSVLAYLFVKQKNMQGAGELLNRASVGGNVAPETAYFIAKYLQAQGDPKQATQILKTATDFKGLFLYRQPAQRLYKELTATAEVSPPTTSDK